MSAGSSFAIREITAADDAAALELERRCPQGGAFRIVFARESFRRRTEGFTEARLLGAWQGGRLVAVGGGALKDLRWESRETRGLMLYDFRVAPEYRRSGIGRQLAQTLIDWGRPRAEIGYAFALGDNRAIQAMAREWLDTATAPAFDLLAYPARRRRGRSDGLIEANPADVRSRHLAARGAADLLCQADEALASRQRIGSWALRGDGASCSAWSSAGVLEEVVVGLPFALRGASWFLGGHLARHLGLPHVPRLGETLKSWLLFDAQARDDSALRELIAAVAARAAQAGANHCHVVLPPGSPCRDALWRGVPRAFAPVLPFSIMARTLSGKPLRLSAPVIDPRDI